MIFAKLCSSPAWRAADKLNVGKKMLTPVVANMSLYRQQLRQVSSKRVTKNLELITNSPKGFLAQQSPNTKSVLKTHDTNESRPLTILLCWLMSKRKHVLKYAQFYLDQGCDVLVVTTNPWQLLWPVKGTQLIARDLLSFVSHNDQYKSAMLHGFSVGGYLWGEALKIIEDDPQKYQPFIDRVVGQIWDSVVDFEGIPIGLPKAVFPKNPFLQSSLGAYVRGHMSCFNEAATKHYMRSSQMFHNNIIKSPALFLCSLDDPVGTMSGIQRVINKWEASGIKVYLKAWENSPHVSHLHHHPEEYIQEMKTFLAKLDLLPFPDKLVHSDKPRPKKKSYSAK